MGKREQKLKFTPLGILYWFFELIMETLSAQALKKVNLGQPASFGSVNTTTGSLSRGGDASGQVSGNYQVSCGEVNTKDGKEFQQLED